MKGKGNYHENLNLINSLKVIQKLSIKPYYYELLKNETGTHRNALRKILVRLIEKKSVIPHKYNFFDKIVNGTTIKTGLEYYILDLDNEESSKYLTNITLDQIVKIYRNGFDHFKEKQEFNSLKSKEITSKDDLKKLNSLFQMMQIVKNTDSTFDPYLYSPELLQNQVKEEMNESKKRIAKLKIEDPEKYAKLMTILNDPFIENSLNEMKKVAKEINEQNKIEHDLVNGINNLVSNGVSKYDILIYFAWLKPSRENYMRWWKLIKNHPV